VSERCPLLGGDAGHFEVPAICAEQCELLWLEHGPGQSEYDEFAKHIQRAYDPSCPHYTSEFSHDVIFVENYGKDQNRRYVQVDQCADCTAELGAESVVFKCPN